MQNEKTIIERSNFDLLFYFTYWALQLEGFEKDYKKS